MIVARNAPTPPIAIKSESLRPRSAEWAMGSTKAILPIRDDVSGYHRLLADELVVGRARAEQPARIVHGPLSGTASRQDDSVTVGRERSQHVEEGTPCSYISHVELERLRDIM
jgi:hypothetical protein